MPEPSIKEHMEVIGADGVHIGTVDRVENGRIKLTKVDSGEGRHRGHHHYIDLSLVAEVEGRKGRHASTPKLTIGCFTTLGMRLRTIGPRSLRNGPSALT